MQNFQVFHSNKLMGVFIDQIFPQDYKKVADVKANNIDDVYSSTNSFEEFWGNNENVTVFGDKKYRSTSMGDIIVDENNNVFRCAFIGWDNLNIKL